MIKNIFFDFDGTLADTAEGIVATEDIVIDRMGLAKTTREQKCSAIGLPLGESLKKGCGIPDERLEEGIKLYRELFDIYAPAHISIFDGVKETLEWLSQRKIKLAIATSRSERSLKMILADHDITKYFCELANADVKVKPKPSPDLVLYLLEKTGTKAEETLVVGDTTYDLDMGHSAGCLTMGVTYGNHNRKMLETSHPDWIVDDLREIKKIVG